jgi:hypothetical protein
MSDPIGKEMAKAVGDHCIDAAADSVKGHLEKSHSVAAIGLAGACVLTPFNIIRTNCILNNQSIPDILKNMWNPLRRSVIPF